MLVVDFEVQPQSFYFCCWVISIFVHFLLNTYLQQQSVFCVDPAVTDFHHSKLISAWFGFEGRGWGEVAALL